MATQGIDRIADSLGHLILSEDGAVINSAGDMENDEVTANKIIKFVQVASLIPITNSKRRAFKRISVIWEDFMYVITVSNRKVFVCKRRYAPQDPAVV